MDIVDHDNQSLERVRRINCQRAAVVENGQAGRPRTSNARLLQVPVGASHAHHRRHPPTGGYQGPTPTVTFAGVINLTIGKSYAFAPLGVILRTGYRIRSG